jgi:hypothetical protein
MLWKTVVFYVYISVRLAILSVKQFFGAVLEAPQSAGKLVFFSKAIHV